MAESPTFDAIGVTRSTIQLNGEAVNDRYQLVSFVVNRQVNRIGKAALVFKASASLGTDITELDDDQFLPGTEIRLSAGYGDQEDCLFEGTIIAVQLLVNEHEGLQFALECRDHAYPMTQVGADQVYEDASDSDMIKAVLADYSPLQPTVKAGTTPYANMVQFNCTDWDFIRSRAHASGAVITVDGKKISVSPPAVGGAPDLCVTYGRDLISFRAELSAAKQPATVVARSWDAKTQQLLAAQNGQTDLNNQGNVSADDLAKATASNPRNVNMVTADGQVLQDRANAEKLWAGLSRIRGSCTFHGTARARIGELIELAGVGSRFSGSAYVGGVEHDYSENGWTTTVSLGLPQDDPLPAPSMTDPFSTLGLHIGVVMKIEDDPRGENRIAIELPMLEQPATKLWARLASSWASDSYGALSVPDVGDEVVVGFQQGDPAEAIVLGSLYSSKRKPERQWDKDNNWHGLNTKSGIKIGLDDEKKAIQVETPGGIKILANDDEKSLSMEDMNGNSLSFSSDGIQLKASKEIKIEAKTGISIKSDTKLEQSAKSDLSIEGMNVAVKAQAAASVKGNASAELSASGQTVVKGAMVMIN